MTLLHNLILTKLVCPRNALTIPDGSNYLVERQYTMSRMLAKSLMVIGFIFSQINIAQAQSWDKPVYQDEMQPYSTGAILYNTYRRFFSSLNKEDSAKHRQSVYFALNNLDNGQDITWYSDDGRRSGTVEIVQTTVKNGDVCRRFFSTVILKSEQRTFDEWACYKNSSNAWSFSDK
jgi:surface antigen